MFESTSLLAIFQVWPTFWMKWTRISLDMTNTDHLESIWVLCSNRLHFWQFSNFGQLFGWNNQNVTLYDYFGPIIGLSDLRCNITFNTFWWRSRIICEIGSANLTQNCRSVAVPGITCVPSRVLQINQSVIWKTVCTFFKTFLITYKWIYYFLNMTKTYNYCI